MISENNITDNLLNYFSTNNVLLASKTDAEKAIIDLKKMGFPTPKTEAWKYTRIKALLTTNFQENSTIPAFNQKSFILDNTYKNLLVFINGIYHKELSKISSSKLIVECLAVAKKTNSKEYGAYFNKIAINESEPFTAMNSAKVFDGAFVYLKKNSTKKNQVYLLHVITGNTVASQFRNLIVAEKNSELEIIQHYCSIDSAKSFNNVVTEISVGENASINMDVVQQETETCCQINTINVLQNNNSHFAANTLTLNGGLVRNNIHVAVKGENCSTELYGLFMPKNKQHIDNHTYIDHIKPHCESRELYKGIVDDQATGIFNGKVLVRPNAQKTNAFQQNNNLLLSDSAHINSKPELEIYADDVKCSHGSTTGQIDEEALFYLKTRGIGDKNAKMLLTIAFVSEVLKHIQNPHVKETVHQFISDRLYPNQS